MIPRIGDSSHFVYKKVEFVRIQYTMLLTDFAPEIIHLIINGDYEVYRGFLAFPQFARAQTPNSIIDWMIQCGVDVHFTRRKIIWRFNGVVHRNGDKPAIIHSKFGRIIGEYYYKHGLLHRTIGPARWYYVFLPSHKLVPNVYVSDKYFDYYIKGELKSFEYYCITNPTDQCQIYEIMYDYIKNELPECIFDLVDAYESSLAGLPQ